MTDRRYRDILNYFQRISEGTKWDGHLFAVGGCVRDEILGSEIHDVDIAVDIPNGGIGFARWLERRHRLAEPPVLYIKFGTAKLRLRRFPDEEIELVQTRAEKYTDKTSRCPEVVSGSIHDDCFRRDFTVNTLYRNIKTGEILDLTGEGVRDIREGVIRTPMDPYETFDDDPVRMLRCLRFAARFGWRIDEATMEALRKDIGRLSIVSRERWSAEFRKMLMGRNLRMSLGELCRLGALKYMNPLVREMSEKRIEPDWMSLLELGIEDVARLEEEGVEDPAQRLAAFFGRIGMLRTEVKDRSGAIRYPRHELIGGNMAAKLLRYMGVEKTLADEVKHIIQEKGEVRLKAERQLKKEKQKEKLRRQREESERLRQERAERHKALLATQAVASQGHRHRRKKQAKVNPES